MERLLLGIVAAAACLVLVRGDIRCHCNAPSCVATGYMCKSDLGQCYSFFSTNGDQNLASYGCADDLPVGKDDLQCRDRSAAAAVSGEEPLLFCCAEDMCNHLAENTPPVASTAKKGHRRVEGDLYDLVPENYENYRTERELWFKAAVIAVPIAGSFILLLLVLLAVRMLRSDKKRHSRLLQMRTHRSLAKAHLYVTDHFQKKQKLSSESFYVLKPSDTQYSSDAKVSLDSSQAYEKLPNDCTQTTALSSTPVKSAILVWGDQPPIDVAVV